MILPYRLEARTTPSRTMQVAVPLIAALLTLVIGFLIFSLVGRDPLAAMHAFFIEPLSSVNGWSELLLKASPLCLIGLGLAIGYRANVWNIGAEGQMLLGGIAASGVAIYFDQATGWWILPTMMIAGVLGGMVWAAIPALLKSRFNTNEILVSLMLTYVATQLLIYLV
ncbi:MAG: ABC transporter permease, partial [Paraburkholderia nemoris]